MKILHDAGWTLGDFAGDEDGRGVDRGVLVKLLIMLAANAAVGALVVWLMRML